uniref:RDD family protein n=1 Tax=Cellvibrio fontiphilus TaxID=1815559 RepID=UPI002B4BAE1F|nr:RDD family protein [Cellvibrio fontiphilus]
MSDQPQTPSFPPPQHVDNTASLGKRLQATIIDVVIMMFCIFPFAQSQGLMEIAEQQGAIPPELALKIVLFQLMMFFVLHGFLLHQFGQTIGKRIIGIAIVTMDNQKPAFIPLILQRYVSQWLMGMVPVIGILLRLADVLAIFRDDRRCIHDHLAKTKVIDLRIPVTTAQAQPNSIIV